MGRVSDMADRRRSSFCQNGFYRRARLTKLYTSYPRLLQKGTEI